MKALVPAQLHELFVQGDGHLRPRRRQKVRPPALLAVGVQRELGHDQQLSAHIRQAAVHFFMFVLKDTQARQLVGQLYRLGFGVLMGHTQQHQKALADLPDDLAVHGNAGVFYTGQYSTHNSISFILFVFTLALSGRSCHPHDARYLLDAAHDAAQLLAVRHIDVQ